MKKIYLLLFFMLTGMHAVVGTREEANMDDVRGNENEQDSDFIDNYPAQKLKDIITKQGGLKYNDPWPITIFFQEKLDRLARYDFVLSIAVKLTQLRDLIFGDDASPTQSSDHREL